MSVTMTNPKVVWELDRISKGSSHALVSPGQYLELDAVQEQLYGREVFRVDASKMEKLSLDPKPQPSDKTMGDYEKRVSSILPQDRKKTHVTADFQKPLEKFSTMMKQMEDMKKDLEETRGSIQNLQDDVKKQKALRFEFEEKHFQFYAANLLLKMIDVMYLKQGGKFAAVKGDGHSQSSKRGGGKSAAVQGDDYSQSSPSRYVHAAAALTPATFELHKLSQKYYKKLQRLPELIAQRNSSAHETQFLFADLLCSGKDSHPDKYFFWRDLFPFCYGKSIEEMAKANTM